jgi:hypothetical protein
VYKVFIRVELRGTPTAETYEALHNYMTNLNWWPSITGMTGKRALPHAMYQGEYDGELPSLVTALRRDIQAKIWTKAVVLAIHSRDWAMVA